MAQSSNSWMVLVDGEERGPVAAATVLEAIRGGLSRSAKVRWSGEKQWTGITDHPAFAPAFEVTASKTTSSAAEPASSTAVTGTEFEHALIQRVDVLIARVQEQQATLNAISSHTRNVMAAVVFAMALFLLGLFMAIIGIR